MSIDADQIRKAKHRERYRWMEEVLADPDLTEGQKNVAVRLALAKNVKTGRCDPGVDTLAEWVSMTNRGVRKALHKLISEGWIRSNVGGRGKGDTNHYELLRRNDGSSSVLDETSAPTGSVGADPDGKPRANDGSSKGERKSESDGQKVGTAVHPNTENNQNTERNTVDDPEAGGGGPHERDLQIFVDKIAELSGLPLDRKKWPRYWKDAVPVVARWRELYHDEIIVAAIEYAMRVKRDGTPSSIKYFDPVIKQWHAEWMRPLPGASTSRTLGSTTWMPPQKFQRCLKEFAECIGWNVVAELTEDESRIIVERWSRGQVTNDELHRIKTDMEGRILARRTAPV